MAATGPTLAGFLLFIRGIMGITTVVLPDNSASIPFALDVAKAIVNPYLAAVGIGSPAYSSFYTLAVYNLAGSNLINYAQDLPDAAEVPGSDPPAPFFAWLRKKWNINGFVSGVINSASDEGTSESMTVQKAAEDFTLADLQYLKDPYGRQYLAFAQRFGTLWGLS